MKKGAYATAPCLYLHLDFCMNPTTTEYLRAATIQALQNKQDDTAIELLSLMDLKVSDAVKALPGTTELTIVDGPSHDYHYWVRFIREQFIPFMTANGRLRFTSHELMTWLENFQGLQLTAGDIEEHSSGKPVWRNTVSNALGVLKQQGLLNAPPFGKEYEIRCPELPSASS